MPNNKVLQKVFISYKRKKYIVHFDEDGIIRVVERKLWMKGHWLERWVETQRYSTKRPNVKSKYNRIIELAEMQRRKETTNDH